MMLLGNVGSKSNKKFFTKYIITGFINTLFGYFIGILNFYIFYELFGIIFVSIISNILAITFSFVTYKFFVFRTSKLFWIKEYFKIYLVYFISFILNTCVLWICIEILFFNIYYSQALSILVTVIISFYLNRNYTFKN